MYVIHLVNDILVGGRIIFEQERPNVRLTSLHHLLYCGADVWISNCYSFVEARKQRSFGYRDRHDLGVYIWDRRFCNLALGRCFSATTSSISTTRTRTRARFTSSSPAGR